MNYPRHREFNLDNIGEPSEQDLRIGALKTRLRFLMGDADFMAFYKTTSFNGNVLEQQLRDKLEELERIRELESKLPIWISPIEDLEDEHAEEWKALEYVLAQCPPDPACREFPWEGWDELRSHYVKLSQENRREFEIHRNGQIRYYSNAKYYPVFERMTRLVMFTGGLRALKG